MGWSHLPTWKKGNSSLTASKSSLGLVCPPCSSLFEWWSLRLVAKSPAVSLVPLQKGIICVNGSILLFPLSFWVRVSNFYLEPKSCSAGPFPFPCWEHTGSVDCAKRNALSHFFHKLLEDITVFPFPWFSLCSMNGTSLCTYAQMVIISPTSDHLAYNF